ncbi:hypothetical protein MHYP_G00337410 [Metynnis hypsauchen]
MRMPVWTQRAEPKPARQPPSQGRVKSSAEPTGQIPETGLDKKRSELLPVFHRRCIYDSIFHVVASVNSEKRQGRASFCHKSLAACFVHTICHQRPPGDKCGLASSSSSPSPPLFSGTRSRGHGEIRTDTFRPHTTAGHTSPAQALRDTNIGQCGNSRELRMKP